MRTDETPDPQSLLDSAAAQGVSLPDFNNMGSTTEQLSGRAQARDILHPQFSPYANLPSSEVSKVIGEILAVQIAAPHAGTIPTNALKNGSARSQFCTDAANRLDAIVKEIGHFLSQNAAQDETIKTYGQQAFAVVIAKALRDSYFLDGVAAANTTPIQFLEFLCSNALSIAKQSQILERAPRPLCSTGDVTIVCLTTYAPVVLIRATKLDVNYGVGALTLLHEIAHYVYWNGFLERDSPARENQTIERQASAQQRNQQGNQPRKIVQKSLLSFDDSVERQAQEIFADVFAIAIGGPLVAVHLLNIIRVSIFAIAGDDGYPAPPVRAAAILRAVAAFHADWETPIVQWWLQAGIAPETMKPLMESADAVPEMREPLMAWAETLVASKRMQRLAQNAAAHPVFRPLIQAVEVHDIDFSRTGDAAIPYAKIDAWRSAMIDGSNPWDRPDLLALSNALAEDGGASTPFPTAAELVKKWSLEEPRPGNFANLKWWPVIDAGGWTTKGPHSRVDPH